MGLLDKLDRRYGRFGVPNITIGVIVCQVVVYFCMLAQRAVPDDSPLEQRLALIPLLVLHGEVWRLATFLIVPPMSNPICVGFFWYLFYLMGSALELHWGTFRYNVYLLLGYGLAIGAAFLIPQVPANNGFVQASVFLAFAFLFPDFELCLFFLVPVKIKWLALLTWIGIFLTVAFADWASRVLALASVGSFLVFFGREILERAHAGRRRMAVQVAQLTRKEPAYYHRCKVCGITDRTHPKMEFRYCSKCDGAQGYCSEHLRNHEHVTTGNPAARA
jgi:hypothetical protein